jgi:hypothetical protein
LKTDGHLVLSYANRDPRAWIALFTSLQRAGFVVVGSSIVHSENETDHSKSGRRACTLDVLIDAVESTGRPIVRSAPRLNRTDDEAAFCHFVGRWALRVGELGDGWEEAFRDELTEQPFLARTRSSA